MIDPTIPLRGGVSSVFKISRLEDFADAVEQALAEEELICGYPLMVISTRQVQYQDDRGNDVFEVYATFGPKEPETSREGERGETKDAGPDTSS